MQNKKIEEGAIELNEKSNGVKYISGELKNVEKDKLDGTPEVVEHFTKGGTTAAKVLKIRFYYQWDYFVESGTV